jgi:two-component system sensor histidine kinase UhpB
MKLPRRPSLRTRISLLLTALAAAVPLALGGLWLHGARAGIHEEVEAATRVSAQWLASLAREAQGDVAAAGRLSGQLRALGRLRANELEILTLSGERLYRSPPAVYKAGRDAPAWFAALATPSFAERRFDAGSFVLVLYPDPSRAVLDAWDDLVAMAGWAVVLLGLLFVAVRGALARALRPLDAVVAALDRTARGDAGHRFAARLPVGDAPELDRLARAFNGMADRLAQAVDENVRLEADREIARRLRAGLEDERRAIARELHDELSQGITAVRALAGAIVQRSDERPALIEPAQHIVAVAGEMQDGVRAILQRLRPPAAVDGLAAALRRHCTAWRERHPRIALELRCALGDAPVGEAAAEAALRIVQEALTNVARHAGAAHVEVEVDAGDGWLKLCIADDGRGLAAGASHQPGCGLGLAGMAERATALGGELRVTDSPGGGVRVLARLPDAPLASAEGFPLFPCRPEAPR